MSWKWTLHNSRNKLPVNPAQCFNFLIYRKFLNKASVTSTVFFLVNANGTTKKNRKSNRHYAILTSLQKQNSRQQKLMLWSNYLNFEHALKARRRLLRLTDASRNTKWHEIQIRTIHHSDKTWYSGSSTNFWKNVHLIAATISFAIQKLLHVEDGRSSSSTLQPNHQCYYR